MASAERSKVYPQIDVRRYKDDFNVYVRLDFQHNEALTGLHDFCARHLLSQALDSVQSMIKTHMRTSKYSQKIQNQIYTSFKRQLIDRGHLNSTVQASITISYLGEEQRSNSEHKHKKGSHNGQIIPWRTPDENVLSIITSIWPTSSWMVTNGDQSQEMEELEIDVLLLRNTSRMSNLLPRWQSVVAYTATLKATSPVGGKTLTDDEVIKSEETHDFRIEAFGPFTVDPAQSSPVREEPTSEQKDDANIFSKTVGPAATTPCRSHHQAVQE